MSYPYYYQPSFTSYQDNNSKKSNNSSNYNNVNANRSSSSFNPSSSSFNPSSSSFNPSSSSFNPSQQQQKQDGSMPVDQYYRTMREEANSRIHTQHSAYSSMTPNYSPTSFNGVHDARYNHSGTTFDYNAPSIYATPISSPYGNVPSYLYPTFYTLPPSSSSSNQLSQEHVRPPPPTEPRPPPPPPPHSPPSSFSNGSRSLSNDKTYNKTNQNTSLKSTNADFQTLSNARDGYDSSTSAKTSSVESSVVSIDMKRFIEDKLNTWTLPLLKEMNNTPSSHSSSLQSPPVLQPLAQDSYVSKHVSSSANTDSESPKKAVEAVAVVHPPVETTCQPIDDAYIDLNSTIERIVQDQYELIVKSSSSETIMDKINEDNNVSIKDTSSNHSMMDIVEMPPKSTSLDLIDSNTSTSITNDVCESKNGIHNDDIVSIKENDPYDVQTVHKELNVHPETQPSTPETSQPSTPKTIPSADESQPSTPKSPQPSTPQTTSQLATYETKVSTFDSPQPSTPKSMPSPDESQAFTSESPQPSTPKSIPSLDETQASAFDSPQPSTPKTTLSAQVMPQLATSETQSSTLDIAQPSTFEINELINAETCQISTPKTPQPSTPRQDISTEIDCANHSMDRQVDESMMCVSSLPFSFETNHKNNQHEHLQSKQSSMDVPFTDCKSSIEIVGDHGATSLQLTIDHDKIEEESLTDKTMVTSEEICETTTETARATSIISDPVDTPQSTMLESSLVTPITTTVVTHLDDNTSTVLKSSSSDPQQQLQQSVQPEISETAIDTNTTSQLSMANRYPQFIMSDSEDTLVRLQKAKRKAAYAIPMQVIAPRPKRHRPKPERYDDYMEY